MPRVTVAIMTHNRAHMLKACIEAALSQSYTDCEFLIMDNASIDTTFEVVSGFKDRRIHYIRHAQNMGSGLNWTEAMLRSRGDLVLVTHDDDLMHPTMVQKQVEAFDKFPDAYLVGTNVRLIDSVNSSVIKESYLSKPEDRIFERGDYIREYLNTRFHIHCPTHMIRRGGTDGAEIHREEIVDSHEVNDIGPAGDIFAVCRCNTLGKVICLGEPLLDYRIHGGQMNQSAFALESDIALLGGVMSHCLRAGLPELVPLLEAQLLRYKATKELISTGTLGWKTHLKLNGVAGECSMPIIPDGRAKALRGKRVAIFGSLLNAFLLYEECRFSGVEVVAFLDNNPLRVGQKIDGKEIHRADSWIKHNPVDAIICSNEKRSKQEIALLLRVPDGTNLMSWRDL